MKIKFNTNLVVNIVVIGIIIVVFMPWLSSWLAPKSVTKTVTVNVFNSWENHLKPIDPQPSENLPHYQYAKLKDSITAMQILHNGDADLFTRSYTLGGFIGLIYYTICDTCSYSFYKNHGLYDLKKRAFIALKGWTISTHNELSYTDEGRFYVKNGQGYVRQAIIDTTFIKPNGSTNNRIIVKDIPVKFRYDHKGDYLLIPLSTQAARILVVVFTIFIIATIGYFFLLIAVFLKFTIDTSKGEIFTDKNVSRLKLIAISLVAYPVLIYGLNYVMKFIFHDYFINGVVLKDNLMPDLWINLVLAIIFLLLYKAFRQGKLLKEEHDLTV